MLGVKKMDFMVFDAKKINGELQNANVI